MCHLTQLSPLNRKASPPSHPPLHQDPAELRLFPTLDSTCSGTGESAASSSSDLELIPYWHLPGPKTDGLSIIECIHYKQTPRPSKFREFGSYNEREPEISNLGPRGEKNPFLKVCEHLKVCFAILDHVSCVFASSGHGFVICKLCWTSRVNRVEASLVFLYAVLVNIFPRICASQRDDVFRFCQGKDSLSWI